MIQNTEDLFRGFQPFTTPLMGKKGSKIPLFTFSHVLYFLGSLVAAVKGAFHVIISFSNLSKPRPFPFFLMPAQLSLLPAKVIFLYYVVTLHSQRVQSCRPYMHGTRIKVIGSFSMEECGFEAQQEGLFCNLQLRGLTQVAVRMQGSCLISDLPRDLAAGMWPKH